MSTIKEVAEKSGFSVATVSRVINNDKNVKDKTRAKILKVIKDLDYKPNSLGQNLRKQRSNTILLVIPTISNPFFAEIIRGAEAAIKKNNYKVITATTEMDVNQLNVYINMLKTNQVDGAIFISSSISKEILQNFVDDYPVVMCNEYFEGMDVSYTTIDNEKASYEATKYLLDQGKKKIAYIHGEIDSSSKIARVKGYKKALEEKNIAFNKELAVMGYDDFNKLRSRMKKFLEMHKDVDGMLINSDIQASIILKLLKNLNYDVPKDMGLVSFDGTIISQIVEPLMTTIAQPMYALGKESVELLIDRLKKENKEVKNVILPYKFLIRET
ncbi:LacI family DNA-binding transcriptional regulator [Vallitalea okinawensis]|uniref:LacI family DNA-binding transcriptional regulator n=1 Tax=Vallitalea okinawensis TaxID=2078660 RepID=UPI000CFBE614|nr:LacI family DNA-binding transcriptional regulator [Vallitalea okinawensis]